MKTIRIIMLALWASVCMPMANAQETKAEQPKGKAIIRIFTNLHTGFGQDRDDRGFELNRSYLGYQYDLGKGLQLKAVMDVGKSSAVDDLQRIAFIKNAQVSWKTGKLTLHGGMISTIQFKVQEDFWGYRYMMMSFQDYYKWGSSADLGISAAYKLTDWLTAEAIVVNGEGYKKVQKNDGLQYGLGATIQPLKGLTVRLYGSLNEGADETKEDISNVATMIGYKGKSFSVAAEYNWLGNSGNVKDADMYGYSVYGTVKMNKNLEAFARYDLLTSKDDWNEAKDESTILAGMQFKLGKYVKLAPNFRMYMPKKEGADNRYMAYISCFFGI
ncbi:MAG: porin [Bacteroidaceae bacterium]|nr:porin [Bacteroidaceae bacterium]